MDRQRLLIDKVLKEEDCDDKFITLIRGLADCALSEAAPLRPEDFDEFDDGAYVMHPKDKASKKVAIGDVVVCFKRSGDNAAVFGKTGIVKLRGHKIDPIRTNRIGVRWFGFSGGHTLDGKAPHDSGWWVNEDSLLVVDHLDKTD